MSLINDALKKAQQRQANGPGLSAGSIQVPAAALEAARSANRKRAAVQILAALLVVVLLVGAAVSITLFMVNRHLKTAQNQADEVTVPPEPPSETATTEQATEAAQVAAPDADPATEIASGQETVTPADNSVDGMDTPERSDGLKPAPQVDPAAVKALLDGIKVRGMTSTRALIQLPGAQEARAYELNETVSEDPLLVLSAIENHRLSFTDAEGKTYAKGF